MMTRTSKITQGAKYAGFVLVLIVALGLSWWSLMTLATDFFGLPQWLAWSVSLAFDGAAIFTAALASEYAKSEDSGLFARLATLAFVAASAWLNWNHAGMMALPLAGKVFFAAPPIAAGLLFELMLKFENRQELRARGKVAQSLPVYGRAAWMRYPKDAFKSMSKVIKHRMDTLTNRETSSQTVSVVKTDEVVVVSEPQTRRKTSKKTELPEWMPSDSTMSVNKLTKLCYDNGVKDIDDAMKLAKQVKGTEVSRGSVQKGLNRAKQSAANVGGYL